MKKYLISLVSILCTTACLSSTIDTDVVLEHDFTIDFAGNLKATGFSSAASCFTPDVVKTYKDINKSSSDFKWKVSDLKEVTTFDETVKIKKLSFTMFDGDSSVTLNANTPTNNSFVLQSDTINNSVLEKILLSNTTQFCLVAEGSTVNNLPASIHGKVSFRLEADFDKNL
jgi:hypothetical protein